MPVSPWSHWASQDLASIRKQYIYTRLMDATWIGAIINELKEEERLLKKRGKGGGKGDGKAKDEKKPE